MLLDSGKESDDMVGSVMPFGTKLLEWNMVLGNALRVEAALMMVLLDSGM